MISIAKTLFIVLLFLPFAAFAQSLSGKERAALFKAVASDERAVAACTRDTREAQIKNDGKPPRISGHCWNGCPQSIPKPHYPEAARQYNIEGTVIVQTIVDEDGKVVWAEAATGNPLLRAAAVRAAYHATYQPKQTCGNRRIKFHWQIKYNFYLD